MDLLRRRLPVEAALREYAATEPDDIDAEVPPAQDRNSIAWGRARNLAPRVVPDGYVPAYVTVGHPLNPPLCSPTCADASTAGGEGGGDGGGGVHHCLAMWRWRS